MLTRFEQKEVFVISSNQNFHRYVRDNLPDGDFIVFCSATVSFLSLPPHQVSQDASTDQSRLTRRQIS